MHALRSRSSVEFSFALMCLFVGLVSFYDAYLVVAYSESIMELEQNPVGRFLIEFNSGDVGLFVSVKAVGTALVIAALIGLYCTEKRLACSVAGGLTAFQFGLSLYLTLA